MTFLIILDGAQESSERLLNGEFLTKTAYTPCLDDIIRHGVSGKAEFFVPKRDADSLTCITTMLGVTPDKIPECRAPLEALGAEINVEDRNLVWRCNIVSTKNGKLHTFNGGNLSKSEMRDFVVAAAAIAPPGIKLFHLSDYRNILVMNAGDYDLQSDVLPPHQNLGLPVHELLSGISNNQELAQFVHESGKIKPGYMLYPWGAGKKSELPQYKQLTGKTAACVCKAEIMAGIAKAMGMRINVPAHATGDFDTDLKEKARAALEFVGQREQCDTVVIHINGTDELAHKRDLDGKIRFIEKIDSNLLSEIVSLINVDARFIVTSDHVTSSKTGRHENLPVNWHCADFKVFERSFFPPPIDADLSDRSKFYKLLQGRII